MGEILVTGGAGFIGSHVCEALLARGEKVTCLDNFVTGFRNNIAHLENLTVMEMDINDPLTLSALQTKSYDAIFHYAATVGVRRTEENPQAVLNDIHGICHVAELAQRGQVGKVIFASSSEVYGEPARVPEEESAGVMGWSPYATVKLYGEYLYASLWQSHKIPTVSLRFFNVYGPRQRGNSYGFVTARFVEQVMSGIAPTVFGDGTQTRDFVYVADNIHAALAALDRSEANGEVINVGSGRETTIADLATTIIAAAPQHPALTPAFLSQRIIEIHRRCAATIKMQALLHVTCDVALREGIQETLKLYEPMEVHV